MPKAKVNNIELYYEIHGQGHPVVFTHGFAGTTSMWHPQIPALSKDYKFITYDSRGHGQSESPPSIDQYSADIVAEDLYQLLKTLGVQKAVVGGLSSGGYQSLRFCITHPEIVTALILMDTGPGYRNPARMEEWNSQQGKRAEILETRGIEAFIADGDAPAYTPRELMLKHNPAGLANMARKVVAQHDSFVIENLEKVKVPTLVMVGDNDTPYIRGSEYMAQSIAGAEYAVIPNAAHAANQENPEFFNKTLLDFLGKLHLSGD
jgi:pimeloyl-ACP methyl ester carboxylesterase